MHLLLVCLKSGHNPKVLIRRLHVLLVCLNSGHREAHFACQITALLDDDVQGRTAHAWHSLAQGPSGSGLPLAHKSSRDERVARLFECRDGFNLHTIVPQKHAPSLVRRGRNTFLHENVTYGSYVHMHSATFVFSGRFRPTSVGRATQSSNRSLVGFLPRLRWPGIAKHY